MKSHTHAERNNGAAIFAILPPEFAYTNNSTIESTKTVEIKVVSTSIRASLYLGGLSMQRVSFFSL